MAEQVQDYLHPFVKYLKSRIESLLTLIEFEENGRSIEPDGFRIKDLSSWSFEKYNSVFESLGSYSSHCNLRCKFCYEEGNPIDYDTTRLTLQEAETKIRYYRINENKGLPIFRQRIYKEPFTNRELLQILKAARVTHPDTECLLTTNGSLFTEEILQHLSELIPINLCVSINSSDPSVRKELMLDRESQHSINMIKKLRSYGISFAGSIVAWPEMNSDEIVKTIRFLDENQARMIRISLPGFSKYYSNTPPFDTKEVWSTILDTVLPMREEVETPILVLPSLYHSHPFLPEIAGIIKNSPAADCSLKFGDIIKSINGQSGSTRAEMQEILFLESRGGKIEIEFERRGQIFREVLTESETNEPRYPYRPAGYPASRAHPMGIILIDDLNPKWITTLLEKIAPMAAENILLMTSSIMEPLVAAVFETLQSVDNQLRDRNVYLWVPEHRFWGGNIMLGDLYTCTDYIEGVKDFMKNYSLKPDLIVIPSSFSPNGYFDILGTSYNDIELEVEIPVILAECSTITM